MQIDYYDLGDASADERLNYCCRLVALAWRKQGKPMLVQVNDELERAQLDELLWSFAADAFIPHCQHGTDEMQHTPVVLVNAQQSAQLAGQNYPLLLNTAPELIEQSAQCERVLWLLPLQEAQREQVRDYYRRAREAGVSQNYHRQGA